MFRTSGSHYQHPLHERSALSESRAFAIGFFVFLLLLFCINPYKKTGDFPEYGIMPIAFASHGTPDIRLSDIQKARRLNPEPFFSDFYQGLEDGIRKDALTPAVAFYRGHDGRHYAIHFFAYSAVAAVPFAVFEAVGIPPYKCYQFVNLACIYLLGLVCLRFFGSARRAAAAVGLFFLCGGALYWNWSSPEVPSAAFLLAGLMLYLGNAPILAGVLAGLASMQNPPLVMFAGFAPVLKCCYQRRFALSAKDLAAPVIVALLFLLPVAFNLSKFGVPNLIASSTTNPGLISAIRLFCFFFDLNQGMLIGVPALFAALAWMLVSRKTTASMRLVPCAALLFSLAMAIPALSTQNWNSGAAGMMRYAFWAAMPLLFACLLQARERKLPTALIVAVFVLQFGATWVERTYRHVEFSPLARFVLANFPSSYNPPFEVFAERLRQQDGAVSKDEVLSFVVKGQPRKIAFNLENRQANLALCGRNKELSLDAGAVFVDDGWVYLNKPPVCTPVLAGTLAFGARDFEQSAAVKLVQGWGGLEFGGANWDGAWTIAPAAQLTITLPENPAYRTLTLCGQYAAPGMQTAVSVNGQALGSLALDRCQPIPVPRAIQKGADKTVVELRHAPANRAAPAKGDTRPLGLFLTRITLQ